MAQLNIKNIKALSPAILILGIIYLVIGIISIINWCIVLANLGKQFYPNLIPGDLGFALVTLTVGASLTTSTYFIMRENIVMHLVSATCGAWLAVGALLIQIMVAAATILDAIIVGDSIDYSIISENLLRSDVIMGCIILPALIYYTSVLRKMVKA